MTARTAARPGEPRLLVRGGRRLSGQVAVSGAKNSALKLMAASLLASGTSVLHNVPDIQDVRTMQEVLEHLGAVVDFADGTMTVDTSAVQSHVAPYELVQRMRASIQIMGPLVARFGEARVAMPGGCNLGPRKIDIHLRGLADMGAKVRSDHGFVEVTAAKLHAIDMFLDYPSVGATESLLMAAVMAEGTTTLENVAREPEIVDLCKFMVSMGADITGAGSSTLKVNGVREMQPAEHTVLGDRIEAGTFLIAGAVTGGEIEVTGISPHVLDLFLSKLRSVGVQIAENTRSIKASGDPASYTTVDVATLPYPGFPTDLQAQMMVLLSIAGGVSVVTENVFENRFGFVDELIRLGADIRVDGNHAVVTGGRSLTGAIVRCPDLRAGAALAVAGLVAEGCTELREVYHIDRGYERFEEKLRGLGAEVERAGSGFDSCA
ncbi:MAG: UDP-N-acetylglucosamine 1-carboxyvinyltransferase [Actinobacteria bacterium RBG_16_64_13]|nr:MAG: UDP-N-acetylglucosamine 1-carboxyvinyltransferase [Actinobacteria bacterium RBG_16_64_13]